jgi:hypothetical protein
VRLVAEANTPPTCAQVPAVSAPPVVDALLDAPSPVRASMASPVVMLSEKLLRFNADAAALMLNIVRVTAPTAVRFTHADIVSGAAVTLADASVSRSPVVLANVLAKTLQAHQIQQFRLLHCGEIVARCDGKC